MGLTAETKRINGQPHGMAERVSTGAEGQVRRYYTAVQAVVIKTSQAGPLSRDLNQRPNNPISCVYTGTQEYAINYCVAVSVA
jgi:hypothetical protein